MHNLDTHQTIKDLMASGISEAQAEAITNAINDNSTIATKEDIKDLQRELKDVQREFKEDIKDLRRDLKYMEDKILNKLIYWIIGSAFSIVISITGIIPYFQK